MAVHAIQTTLGSGATQVSANTASVTAITFQNNAAAVMRIGDSSVTSSKGYSLAAGATWNVPLTQPTQLNKYYVVGTSTQVLDVIYDDGGL